MSPRIVIVGGGFGGLTAAKALSNLRAEVVLIDRANHHLFQPLLYQVATSVLAPSQIGFPIRGILQKHLCPSESTLTPASCANLKAVASRLAQSVSQD
jgi:NADH dehydrogenase FAD-containing subunit